MPNARWTCPTPARLFENPRHRGWRGTEAPRTRGTEAPRHRPPPRPALLGPCGEALNSFKHTSTVHCLIGTLYNSIPLFLIIILRPIIVVPIPGLRRPPWPRSRGVRRAAAHAAAGSAPACAPRTPGGLMKSMKLFLMKTKSLMKIKKKSMKYLKLRV